MISFRDVTKKYATSIDVSRTYAMRDIFSPSGAARTRLRAQEILALDNLSFDVDEGETLLVLGFKESGKTTIAKLICGFTYPTAGTVDVNGKVRFPTRQRIGATPVMRLREYTRLLAMMFGEESSRVGRTVEALLEKCHLTEWKDVRIHNVPDGAIKRLGYFASLAIDAEVFVFDDTYRLRVEDTEVQQTIDARLQEIFDSRTSVVLASSPPPKFTPDRTLVLHGGQVIYHGDPELAAASYERLAARIEEAGEAWTDEEIAPAAAFLSSITRENEDGTDRVAWDFEVSLDADKELRRIAESDKPIVVGPYLTGLDTELLLWIPFVRWAVGEFGIGAERLTCLSRGGADYWYEDLCETYVDALDLMPAEFEERQAELLAHIGKRQTGIAALDRALHEACLERLGITDDTSVEWLHPSLFYRLLTAVWRATVDPSFLADKLVMKRLSAETLDGGILASSGPYIAVWFAPTLYLQASQPLNQLLASVLETIGQETMLIDVVSGNVLEPPFERWLFTESSAAEAEGRIIDRDALMRKTSIIAGAEALLSSHGGLSHLGPLCRVPTITVFDEPACYRPTPTGWTAVNFHIARVMLERLTGSVPLAFEASQTSAEDLSELIGREASR